MTINDDCSASRVQCCPINKKTLDGSYADALYKKPAFCLACRTNITKLEVIPNKLLKLTLSLIHIDIETTLVSNHGTFMEYIKNAILKS